MNHVDRKYRILQAIIDDYILTALPVGSRTISRKYEQKLSSATIRNEMSDLEELGYLDSPHTSAGRIPSYKAYRLYVDSMLQPLSLSAEENAYIRSCFDRRMRQVDKLSAHVAGALANMTHYTTAVMTRSPRADQVLSHLQMVPLSDKRILLVLVMKNGSVRQSVVELSEAISSDDLYTVSKLLSRQLEGSCMADLSDRLMKVTQGDANGQLIAQAINEQRQPDRTDDISTLVVGGRSNLLSHPEYSDLGKAQALLSVLETREKLVSLLSQDGEMEISVRIGPETGMEETKDCSVITASYRLGNGQINTIGLIGPTRMQYGRAVSILQTFGRTLAELSEDESYR